MAVFVKIYIKLPVKRPGHAYEASIGLWELFYTKSLTFASDILLFWPLKSKLSSAW